MMALARTLLTLGLLLLGAYANAQTQAKLEQALAAYGQAQAALSRAERMAGFQRAYQLFDDAVRQGLHNADLYTNLGTAALQAERLGPAVLAYRRALALDPDQRRARQNLAHARGLQAAWVPQPQQDVLDSFFFWHRSWSINERMVAAAICFLLAALGIAMAIGLRSGLLRNLALAPLLLWIGLLSSVAIEQWSAKPVQAVIMADGTIARAADSINAPVRFAEPLDQGIEVDVLEIRAAWARIALADGRDAWVRLNNLALIDNSAITVKDS